MTVHDESPTPGLLDVEEHEVRVDLEALSLPGEAVEPRALRRARSAMATLVALVVATYAVPFLDWARPWTPADPVPFWNVVGREWLGHSAATEDSADRVDHAQKLARRSSESIKNAEDATVGATEGAAVDSAAPQPLEDPSGSALDAFYGRLVRTETGGAQAITRVAHWGDSAIGGDGITSAIRRRMQARFGDAGHGFLLLQPPNLSYKHKNVRLESNGKWKLCSIVHRCKKDGRYGYAGVTFWSNGGARSIIKGARPGSPAGRDFARFELWYAGQPGGGTLKIRVDNREPEFIATASAAFTDRWHVVDLPDGPHTVRVTAPAARFGLTASRSNETYRGWFGIAWRSLARLPRA